MSQFNLFTWVREGVRQSVLLGVSDALGQIGTPDQDGSLNKEIQTLLDAKPGVAASQSRRQNSSRKRLGRSLREIDLEKKTA